MSNGFVGVVVTDFGEYFPTPDELAEFKRVHGFAPVRAESYSGEFITRKWESELTKHATSVMRQRFDKGAA